MLRKRARFALLGVPIDNVSMDETIQILDGYIQSRTFQQVATANVDFLLKAIRDRELMEILHRCSLVVSDGVPLVWASRMLRTPLKGRVNGTDLIARLAQLSAEKQYRIFLLGAQEKRAEGATRWIETTYPGAVVAGRYSPPNTPLDEMDHEEILRRIGACAPDILLVAFGNPKQEKWIARHAHRLGVPVCVGIGGSFDFLSGECSRAPLWMQRNGLEWLHRVCSEPQRLAGRYASNIAGIARFLSVHLLVMAAQPGGTRGRIVSHRTRNETAVFSVSGRFTGEAVVEFEALVDQTVLARSTIVVDLVATRHIGADALGALITLGERMRMQGRDLWLAGVGTRMRRVLRSAFLEPHFRFAPQVADALTYVSATARAEKLQTVV